MKKIILSFLMMVMFGFAMQTKAQSTLEYAFTGQYVSTYTTLDNPTTLFAGTFDDMMSSSITIPGIVFGGIERTSIRVSTNGWVGFGSPTANSAYFPISNTMNGADGVISPFGMDLINADASSSISYSIVGEIVTIEWANMKRFGATSGSESLNFQLILDTGNNAIYFVYDAELVSSNGTNPQVGMKIGGGIPVTGQYVNRLVTTANNWNTSEDGTTAAHSCRITTTAPATFPETGLTYSWNGIMGGCMDSNACNFDILAEVDNGSCEYCSCNPLCGCTDPGACNYDSNASIDDGSCYTEINVMTFGDQTICPGTLQGTANFYPTSEGASILWSTNSSSTIFSSESLEFYAEIYETSTFVLDVTDVNGCTGSATLNVTVMDCVYGCMDTEACNFNADANTNSGDCDYSCLGCTDSVAMNYNPGASIDNGTCIYPGDGTTCSNPTVIACSQGVYVGMTVGVANDNATSDANACGGGSNGGQRWFVYISPYTSEITVSTINSMTNFDTYLKAYTGVCGDLVCVAQNDDIPGTGFQSQIVFDAVAGETYLIRVGGFATMQGTFGLTFNCGGGCLDVEACNYNADAPFDDGSCTYGADCYGCTDVEANNYDPIAVYDQGCQYSPSILVYHDVNGDGMHQTNEPGLANWPVYIPGLSATIFSNSEGYVITSMPSSTFSLELINEGTDWLSSSSSTTSISVPDNMEASFGLIPATGETFLVAGPYDGFWDIIHCTDGYEAGVFINNTGAVGLNGTLTMTCDESFMPEQDVYMTIAPDQVSAGFAQWNLVDFEAGGDGLFSFHIDGPGVDNIGVTYPFVFHLTLVDGNGDVIYDETWTTTPFIACSYDPNDLTATPEGYADQHFILPSQRLQFRVRFQNTGNLPAEDILIIDQLDPQVFNLSTFAPMYGSDIYTACLHDDGTIDFIFEDIYLPDATNNEEESHGFVVYEVDARADIIPGTVLLNQANIFFDANPAIITNETFHTIFDCSSFTPMTGSMDVCEGQNIELDAQQNYVETYTWSVEGNVVSQEAMLSMEGLTSDVYNVVLITGNPLCEETHESNVEVHGNPTVAAIEDISVCDGESVTLTATSDANISWNNGIENGVPFAPVSTMMATVTATNDAQCIATDEVMITVHALPGTALLQSGSTLIASDGTSWQWYHNGNLMEGETGMELENVTDGEYYAIVTNADGCSSTSETVMVVGVGELSNDGVVIFPNPMNNEAVLTLPDGSYYVTIHDVTGRLVQSIGNCNGRITLNRGNLTAGQYEVRIVGSEVNKTLRLLVN